MAFIYKITNKINGKIYIGQTTRSVHERWLEHCSNARAHRNNSAIDKAISKYGEDNFDIECLEEVADDKRFERETEYIKKYSSMVLNGHGYNIAIEGFDIRGYEIKPSKPIIQYSLDGVFIQRYTSLKECIRFNNKLNPKGVYKALKGEFSSYKGFLWKYEDDNTSPVELVKRYKQAHLSKSGICRQRKIAKIDKDTGITIDVYDSLTDAAKEISPSRFRCIKSNISQSIKTNGVSHGYRWEYLEELEYKPCKKIAQIAKDNQDCLAVYENAAEAARTLGVSDGSGIHKAAKKGYLSYGYFWKYI